MRAVCLTDQVIFEQLQLTTVASLSEYLAIFRNISDKKLVSAKIKIGRSGFLKLVYRQLAKTTAVLMKICKQSLWKLQKRDRRLTSVDTVTVIFNERFLVA